MKANHVAENVFGTIGAMCWTFQLIPQIWKSWRERSTQGLSPWLVFLWGIAGAFYGTYTLVQNLNIPLKVQPHLFSFFSFISWGQCQYYGKGRSALSATLLTLVGMVVTSAYEVGMVYTIKPSYENGSDAGVLFLGIGSSVVLAAALLPQYWEIYKAREVMGISYLFIFVDMMGGIFSDLSLLFKGRPDLLATLAYTIVVVMDGIILLLALFLNPRAARRRKQAAEDKEHGPYNNGNSGKKTDISELMPSHQSAAPTSAEISLTSKN